MKKSLLIIVALFGFFTTVEAQEWITDFEVAKNLAVTENKKIVAFFSGSDWCPPCKKLNANIFSTEEFKKYATENYIMLRVDFPKKKKNILPEEQQKHNDQLAEKFNIKRKFPSVIVFDKNGSELGKTTGYLKITPKEYIELLNSFKS